jgi:competence protein ComEC
VTGASRRADVRLALPALSAWVTAAATQTMPVGRTTVAVVVASATAVLAGIRGRWLVAGLALGVAAGGAAMAVHVAALHRGAAAALARESSSADLRMTLVRDPFQVVGSAGRHLVVADATVTGVSSASGAWTRDRAPVVVFAAGGGWLGLLPGQRLEVRARLREPREGDIVAAVVLPSDLPRLIGQPPVWQRWAARVRDGLRSACAGLGDDRRGLLPGLVLGDVAAMPPSLTNAFRVTGLTHLNAVSGANVAIVVGAATAGVRRLGAGRVSRAWLAAAALLAFVVLVRPQPSVLRAAVMGAVVLLAALLGRRASPIPVLAGAVLLLLVLDPFLARTPGFALSVLATASIVLLAPAWTERLARRMPRPLAAAIAVPAAAQLACTPVIVAAFGQLTPWAIPANLLAAPAVAPATLLGLAAALVGVVLPPVAAGLAWTAGLAAGWLVIVARMLSHAPGAGLRWPTGWPGVLLFGVAALSVVAAVRVVCRRHRARAMLDPCPR